MLKKIGLVTFADAITKGIGYLLLPIYLGLMTQREFGEFSFIFIIISPLSILIGLSLYVPFIRNFCSHKSSHATRKELVSTVFNSLFIWLIIIIKDYWLYIHKILSNFILKIRNLKYYFVLNL